jgi:hypothetical protein
MYYSKKQPIGCYIMEFLTSVKMFIVQAAGRKKESKKQLNIIVAYSINNRLG